MLHGNTNRIEMLRPWNAQHTSARNHMSCTMSEYLLHAPVPGHIGADALSPCSPWDDFVDQIFRFPSPQPRKGKRIAYIYYDFLVLYFRCFTGALKTERASSFDCQHHRGNTRVIERLYIEMADSCNYPSSTTQTHYLIYGEWQFEMNMLNIRYQEIWYSRIFIPHL